ncbi:class E sortase [Psychromicrobium sp. YIM B11713]|uniref:class E sortase n=1 Tax=Psychromicrobium sp. YIM B11713 TaxID=3145233 RepID=UPI00374F5CEC
MRDRSNRSRRQRSVQPKGVFRTIVQVIGELLITLGVVLMLFVGWELWWTNLSADQTQQQAAQQFAGQLQGPVDPSATTKNYGEPVVTKAPTEAMQTFGLMYIPRFGPNYAPRPLVQGTNQQELDTLGLGHYPDTSMPGAVGNFAVAGHRQTHGAVLDNIHTLVPGDKIYVQTKDGYYTYVFRNTEIVLPSQVSVLYPVPTVKDAAPKERILTMTSCNPRFGAQERIIAYSVMESWQPLSAGPPAAIAAQFKAIAGKG